LIISKKLLKYKKLRHGFFNRLGGKSNGIYKSLNCGVGSKDNRNKVKQNLKIVRKKISNKSNEIFLLHQFHSNKFVYIGKESKLKHKRIKADAAITDRINFPIAVLTADCVPILIYDKKRLMIAAIHAGWKGAYKDIISKVIKFMIKKGCKQRNMIAAVGPCIVKKNYEVKQDFKNRFLKKNRENKLFFDCKNSTIYFDLPNYIRSQLKLNKITNIDMKNIDTFNKKNKFFSARQA